MQNYYIYPKKKRNASVKKVQKKVHFIKRNAFVKKVLAGRLMFGRTALPSVLFHN